MSPKPQQQAAPATKQPRFMAKVSATRNVVLARFGKREEPLPEPESAPAQGLAERREAASLADKRATGPLSGPHLASAGAPLHGLPTELPPERAAPPPTPPSAISDTLLQRERERLKAAVERLELQAERLAEQARADAMEIAFQLAQKVVEGELRISPEPLFSLVRSALKQAGEARRVKLRLNPADAEIVRTPKGNEAISGLSIATIEIVGDASLQRGDCLIDTDFGHVDGRLSTRFSELRRALSVAGGDAA